MIKEPGTATPGGIANADTSFDTAMERHLSMVESPSDLRHNSVSYQNKTRSLQRDQRDSTVLDIIAGRGRSKVKWRCCLSYLISSIFVVIHIN